MDTHRKGEDAPTTDAPSSNAPTTDAPSSNAPTTDAPTTDGLVPDGLVPDAPVDGRGRIHYGRFHRPFKYVNLHQALPRVGADAALLRGLARLESLAQRGPHRPGTSSSKNEPSARPSLARRLTQRWVDFRLKEWQHYLLISPQVLMGFAVVDAKFLATSWCHVVPCAKHTSPTLDPQTPHQGAFEHTRQGAFEHTRQGAFLKRHIARELWDDTTSIQAPGYAIRIHNNLAKGQHRFHLDIQATQKKTTKTPRLPAVRGEFRALHDLSRIDPLVVVLPVGPNQAMYSHKVALPVEGHLELGALGPQTTGPGPTTGQRLHLDPRESVILVDVHKAHYPHHTWWNWATFAGRDDTGRRLALNLTHNVNPHDRRTNENALWIDGRAHRLGAARFQIPNAETSSSQPWRIHTTDGRVHLTFHPRGARSQHLDLGVLKTSFRQPYGTFNGTIKLGEETLHIRDLTGVCEDHDSLW